MITKEYILRLECLLNNNKNSDFCAPLTSFDWNEVDPNLLGTSSIDTTCTVWGLETDQASVILDESEFLSFKCISLENMQGLTLTDRVSVLSVYKWSGRSALNIILKNNLLILVLIYCVPIAESAKGRIILISNVIKEMNKVLIQKCSCIYDNTQNLSP